MKASAIALTTAAMIFSFAAPSVAATILSGPGAEATVVDQKAKCKEGEKWNAEAKKCEKDES
jgi:hypothetical protein